jgi:hypothetical protein
MNREECKVPKEVSMELNTWPSQVSGSRVPGTQGEMDPLRRQKEKKIARIEYCRQEIEEP